MKYCMIASMSNDYGIGYKNSLPWRIPDDMVFFKRKTINHIVVMGRNTYFSIPETRRPLKDRLNIVVTSTPNLYESDDTVVFCKIDEIIETVQYYENNFTKCFIIGGQKLYEHFLDKVDYLYLTRVYKNCICDTFFPSSYQNKFNLVKSSGLLHSKNENCDFQFEKYKSSKL